MKSLEALRCAYFLPDEVIMKGHPLSVSFEFPKLEDYLPEGEPSMSDYCVGLDLHKVSICIAVLNTDGKLVRGSVIGTSAVTILDFLKGVYSDVEALCTNI